VVCDPKTITSLLSLVLTAYRLLLGDLVKPRSFPLRSSIFARAHAYLTRFPYPPHTMIGVVYCGPGFASPSAIADESLSVAPKRELFAVFAPKQ